MKGSEESLIILDIINDRSTRRWKKISEARKINDTKFNKNFNVMEVANMVS